MAELRFHWDFFGPDAQGTAEHFCKHLGEFCAREGVVPYRTSTAPAQGRCVATLACDEQHLVLVRDRLRPKRAERVQP
ncbi:MAG: hypothetical protein JST66_02560 [Bacteroidetes bacterium]|nr:hypothetical protein [Bacteroidota bacterium]